jgi:5-oxoprolinase (ATP-hydrolysing)
MREAAIEQPLAGAVDAVATRLESLARDASAELARQGVSGGQVTLHRRVHVRYEGTDSALVVPFGSAADIRSAFETAYRQRFAFLMHERALIVEAVSVEAVGAGDAPAEPRHPALEQGRARWPTP